MILALAQILIYMSRMGTKSRVVQVNSEETWKLFTTQAINQASPIVAHFTAIWCMPAVAMKPLFEEQALIHKDVIFLSVDVDEVKGVAEKMEIKAMPTFVMMNKEGGEADKVVGANPDEIKKRIAAFIHSIRTHKS